MSADIEKLGLGRKGHKESTGIPTGNDVDLIK